MGKTLALATVLSIGLICNGADAADDFYKGKTIKITVGTAPVGGYDGHSRILARHLGRYIPGNPSIIVQNQPGGGGLQATNHIFVTAAKDGTEIGLFNRNTVLSGLLGIDQAKYKVEEFNWLGTTASFSNNAHLFVMTNAVPHKTIEDIRGDKLPSISIGNEGSALVRVLKEALGLNVRIIEGYKNDEIDLAFERGEIDGHTISWLSLMQRVPYWIEKGFARPMVQFGRSTRLPAIPDVPTARELAQGPENVALMLFAEAPLQMGYPFALPPGVPEDRVATLRKAFKDTLEDAEYRAEIEKAKLELTPKYGNEVQEIIAQISKSPAGAMQRYKKLLGAGG